MECFADPTIGCVGGRPRDATPVSPGIVVGRIDRFGRLTGNHGVGSGPMRDVDAVAGGSMALRADALALPCAGVLLGTGAEPFNEMLIAAWARKAGYRVVYDPAIVVDHRLSIDQLPQEDLARGRASADWTRAVAHNWLVGVTAHGERPVARVLAYGLLVGTRGTPGLVRTAVAITRGERDVVRRLPASVRGQLAGARAARAGAARRMVSCADLRNAREGD